MAEATETTQCDQSYWREESPHSLPVTASGCRDRLSIKALIRFADDSGARRPRGCSSERNMRQNPPLNRTKEPHDLRRTCAKLCHTSGGEIEQIQFLLGHASVQTTERYLGCKQNLGHPVNDLFRLGNVDTATYVVLAGGAALTVRAEGAQPVKMSDDESGGDQERSDERASTGFYGNGHPSV